MQFHTPIFSFYIFKTFMCMCMVQVQSAHCQKHESWTSRLKIEPFYNHHSRFQLTWYVQHTQIEMQKVRRTRCKFPGSKFSRFSRCKSSQRLMSRCSRISRCKFSRHQCPGFPLWILLTTLSLEAVATASVISIHQLWIKLPFCNLSDGRH